MNDVREDVRFESARLAIALVALVAFAVALPAPATAQVRGESWIVDVALDLDTPLSGCAIGDVRADVPGEEIVVVGSDGAIHVIEHHRGRYRSEVVYRGKGELLQVAVGELDPGAPGMEIVAVGMAEGPERPDGPGVAVYVRRTPDGWRAATALEVPALVHGVCIHGGKAYVTGFDAKLHVLAPGIAGLTTERCVPLPAAGKSVLAVAAAAVFVACTDGSVVRVGLGDDSAGDAGNVTIDRREAGRARLGTDGERLLVADDDGTLSLLTPPGAVEAGQRGEWQREELWRDTGKLRGAILADLDASRPGLEAATVGYSHQLTVLRHSRGRWRSQTVATDHAPLHHLACGDVDGRPGRDLVACGFSGKVLVARRGVQPLAGPQADDWTAEVALDAGTVLGGCATGDLLPDREGDEIAAVARDGSVHVVWREGGEWASDVAHRGRGELIQVTIGDALPEIPGDEIIAVGVVEGVERPEAEGIATIVWRTTDGWRSETMLRASALQHGACVHDGQVFVTGYDNAVHRLWRENGAWQAEAVGQLPGAGKGALSTPFGVLITCTDGSLVAVRRDREGWSATVVDRRESGRSRVGSDGARVIVSDNDGTLSILYPSDGGAPWRREAIHREFDLLRGAVLADLDPAVPGIEAATAGYEHEVSLLHRHGGRWWSRMLYRDADRLHHLTVGDVDGVPGLDLVACGFAGRLIVLRRLPR